MLIIGAKGFAKEVLEILYQKNDLKNIAFYDDSNEDVKGFLFERFSIIKNMIDVKQFFNNTHDNKFTIGIGGPLLRNNMYLRFKDAGGIFTSTISPFSHIGHFGNHILEGCNIMTGTVITNEIQIGRGVLLNLNCTIGHNSVIGNFVEMSPGVHVSGNCTIGNYVTIGTNASILPKLKIGNNTVIGAGSVVTKDLPANCLAIGVPAKVIKEIPPINL
jgi:sugar O-acyltransferase (sialic acid O-acetyltransferase NeuD family)